MEKIKSAFRNFKSKAKNYGFWISLCSAILLVLGNFGIKLNVPYIEEVVSSVLGVFVLLGVISNPKEGKGYIDNIVKKKDVEIIDSANEKISDK